MVKSIYRPLVLVALFGLAACSGGTSNSSVPESQALGAQSGSQAAAAVTRTALDATTDAKTPKPPKPQKMKPPKPCPKNGKEPKGGDFASCLYDDAILIHPGNASNTAVQLTWGGTVQCVYPNTPPPGGDTCDGGVNFNVPDGFTVSQLNTLSADYKFTVGTCTEGSPRFQVNVTNGAGSGNVFVYFGPQYPSTNAPCAGSVYMNSGNLLGANGVDATQVGGGYESWAAFQATDGSDSVTGIQLVVDGYVQPPGNCTGPPPCYTGTPNYITAQFDNVAINSNTTTFE